MKTYLRIASIVTATVLLSLTGVNAADQPTTFKAGSDVVLVPVTVRDASGAPVTGLTKDAFSVSESGKPQTITVFEEVHTATGAQPGTGKPNLFTNEISGDTQPQTRFNGSGKVGLKLHLNSLSRRASGQQSWK